MRISEEYLTGHNLHVSNPELVEEWHPTKNGSLTPKDVTPGSQKRVWWKCPEGHEWQARIFSRSRGNGCPFCAGQAVSPDNCFQTLNPSLVSEWHPTRNGNLTPRDATKSSNKKVWWKCKKGHQWQATILNRSNSRQGCPCCAGKAACRENCLQNSNPHLAREWHPTKNGKLTPGDVTPKSGKKVWWRCKNSHEW
jgi:hypothetical protein